MAIFRVNKTDNYTVMSNHHLRDKNLSLKSKGLLSVMLSLPPEWDYSIAGLCSILKENETAIKSALKELKDFGYLTITKKYANQTSSHRIEYEYDVYEKPSQPSTFQPIESLGVEHLYVENQGQINKDKLSTKDKINNNRSRRGNPTISDNFNSRTQEISSENNKSTYTEMKDMEIEDLERLKQIVLENRHSQKIKYRDIQNMFNLMDTVTYDTPLECTRLIEQKRNSLRTERSAELGPEVF